MPRSNRRKATIKQAAPERVELSNMIGNADAPTFAPHQVRVMNSFLDFMLLLGELQIDAKGAPEMHQVALITLSPQHAKALAKLLLQKIVDYEDEFGTIPEPPPEQA